MYERRIKFRRTDPLARFLLMLRPIGLALRARLPLCEPVQVKGKRGLVYMENLNRKEDLPRN